MKTKNLILILALTIVSLKISGQQVPLFSQYLFNGFLVNPAYAGLDGLSAVNLTTREDFVGMPNAPQTYLVSFQTRLLKNSFVRKSASARRKSMSKYTSGRVGVGGFIFNDRVGLIMRTGGQVTYAYHLKLYNGAIMSMAISGSIHQFSVDKSTAETGTSDKLLNQSGMNKFIPDAGFGLVYSTKQYYAGLSIDQLLQSYLKLGASGVGDKYKLYRQYTITGGYRYDIDKLTGLEPTLLLKVTQQAVPQLDISCKYIFNKDYWGGMSLRTGSTVDGASTYLSAIVLMGGLTYQRYHFGYAFDYNLSGLGRYTYGSHEFMVAYKFGDNASRLRWLNR